MRTIATNAVYGEIKRFKSVAEALDQEKCSIDFILSILINHLKIKFKDIQP